LDQGLIDGPRSRDAPDMKRGLIRHREALRWEEWARRQTGDDVASASRRCQHAHARDQTNSCASVTSLLATHHQRQPAAVHLCRPRSHDPNPTIRPRSPRGDYAATLASVRALISRRLPTSNTYTRRLPFIFHPPPCLPGPSIQQHHRVPTTSQAIHSLTRSSE
jgi:hypothetical protein